MSAIAPATAAGAGVKLESLKRITGGTPFPDACGNPDPRAAGSETDPLIAVDPNHDKRMIVSYGQDRMLDGGGFLAGVIARSNNGGRKWREALLPKTTKCTEGKEERTSSPKPAIGPDGTVYALSEAFTIPDDAQSPFTPNPLILSRSRDGAASFEPPRTIVDAGQPEFVASITADPRRPGHAYAVWTRPNALGLDGPEYFSRTTDFGENWSEPRAISPAVPAGRTDPNLIEVLPNGDLLNLYVEHNISVLLPRPLHTPYVIRAQRSTNRGRSWSRPSTVAEIPNPGFPADPDSGIEIDRTSMISTGVARDGTAYVVWNDNESARSAHILLARSRDGGRQWSEPKTVAALSAQALYPALAVGRDGSVGVSFYDFRKDVSGDGVLSTDVWLYYSHNEGRKWRHKHLAGSFDALKAPRLSFGLIESARHLGGLDIAALPGGFGAVFVKAGPKAERGPTDVFFARLRLRKPRVRISGLPPRCVRRDFRIDVRVKSGSGLERVRVFLGGTRIGKSGQKRFTTRVPAAGLSSGRHRIRVEAQDRDGAVGTVAKRFRRCARR